MSETKKCKYCQSEIDKKAKLCPNCRKKQGGKAKFIILGIIVLFILVGAFGNNDKDNATTTSADSTESEKTDSTKETKTPKETEKPIEYTAYKVSDMMDELDSNAMNAEDKYTDQYVEITGKLSNIDSDGKYIDLVSAKDEFAIMGVQCYIKSDDQSDKVKKMSKDDTITLKGKITSVGEVMGYSLDITEIE